MASRLLHIIAHHLIVVLICIFLMISDAEHLFIITIFTLLYTLKMTSSKKYKNMSVSSVTQSCLTLRPHELQHARPPCPSPTPGVYSNSCPSSQPGFDPWVTCGSSTALPGPSLSTMDSASRNKDRGSANKWSLFGPRSLQKSDSGVIRAEATQTVEEPAPFKPPKIDIPVIEGTKQLPRAYNPQDLNVLTPTGF
ncbi:hypothetical protein FD755_008098 [Muntiacus reevesi]|uniref:Putative monooxygenase p33MONOX n=1 Tax=Muntiacus reevesi TaxID=9886 RepID=A0A5J5MJD7_MUNRE|nr:hypothetical protein FD755_008098 [Muntiacus reevesi]